MRTPCTYTTDTEWFESLSPHTGLHLRLENGLWGRGEVIRDGEENKLLLYDVVVAEGLKVESHKYADMQRWDARSKSQYSSPPHWYTRLPQRTHLFRPKCSDVFESPSYSHSQDIDNPQLLDGRKLYHTPAAKRTSNSALSETVIKHLDEVEFPHPVCFDPTTIALKKEQEKKTRAEAKRLKAEEQKKAQEKYKEEQEKRNKEIAFSQEVAAAKWNLIPSEYALMINDDLKKIPTRDKVIFRITDNTFLLAITSILLGLALSAAFITFIPIYAFPIVCIFFFVTFLHVGMELSERIHKKWNGYMSDEKTTQGLDALKKWCAQKYMQDQKIEEFFQDAEKSLRELRDIPGASVEDEAEIVNLTRLRINHYIALAFAKHADHDLDDPDLKNKVSHLEKEIEILTERIVNTKHHVIKSRLHMMMHTLQNEDETYDSISSMNTAIGKTYDLNDLHIEPASDTDEKQIQT